MERTTVALGEIAYRVEGSGRPWLLVHGFPLDHSMWRGQIEFLAERARVVAVDLPGFGMTAPLNVPAVTMAALADSLAQLLDHLAIDQPVTYVGLSMGGYIGWEFYRRHEERVGSMVMCDTRAAADTEEAKRGREETARRVLQEGSDALVEGMLPRLFAERTREEQAEIVEQTAAVMRHTSPATIAAALRGMAQRSDMSGLLEEITVPTLLLGGSEDRLTPPDEMARIAASLPAGTWCEIAHAGHMAPLEQPGEVNRRLEAWWSAVDGTGAGK